MPSSPPEGRAGRGTRAAAVVLALAAAVALGLLFRLWFSSSVMPPPPRMQGETTQAYRYARMVSERGYVPAVDPMVMHPEGFRVYRNSVFEEYIAGWTHRAVGGDFDRFIRLFVILFPLLSVPALYLWMRTSGTPALQALTASALYAALFPALLRARGGSLYRETVALPLLVTLGWLVDGYLAGDRTVRRGAASGLLLLAALACWKVTAFLSAFLFLWLLLRRWEGEGPPARLCVPLASAQLIGSVLLPHMRSDAAWRSPATVLALSLLVLVLLRGRGRRWLVPAGAAAALATFAAGTGSTGHVGAVVLAKLRFLFSHPEDPALLSPDARLFWVSGYTSPTPGQMLLLFGVPVLLALPGIPGFVRRYRGRAMVWLPPLALGGYLLFDRLHVLLAIALVPILAESMRRRWMVPAACAALLLQSCFPATVAGAVRSAGLDLRDDASLLAESELSSMLSWLRRETAPDDAVLAYWHISGMVSAYAERPVVISTFFESEENRETIHRFAEAVFGPEESLLALMRENEADLVIHQADFILDRSWGGLLYLAGLREVPGGSAAELMHWAPDSLDSLRLVWSGPSLRVLARGDRLPAREGRSFLFEERYAPYVSGYDEARAVLADPLAAAGRMADVALDTGEPDMMSGALLLSLSHGGPEDVSRSMLSDLAGMYIRGSYGLDRLSEDAASFERHAGANTELRLLMARLYAAEGRIEEAIERYGDVLEADPDNPDAISELQAITGPAGGKL